MAFIDADCPHQLDSLLSADIKKNLVKKMQMANMFAETIRFKKKDYLLTFYPIHNFSKKHAGYFFSLQKDIVVASLRKDSLIASIITGIILLVLCLLFAYVITSKQKIKKQAKNLEDLNNTKDRFFSIIAHDLKNPFNAIIGFGDLLEEAIKNEFLSQSEEYVKKLNNASSNAYFLLENLLQWARTESGRLKIKPTTLDLSQLIYEVQMLYLLQAQEKQVELVNKAGQGYEVMADYDTLSAIFRNLLSNGIKFTPTGGQVYITAQHYENVIEVSVRDTGIGINTHDISKIFDKSALFSTPGTHDEKGTGLGLVLCKEFAEHNNGELRVESQVGKGTCFTLTLPKPPDIMFASDSNQT